MQAVDLAEYLPEEKSRDGDRAQRLRASTGAEVRLEETGLGERFRVLDERGELVFEYDTTTRKTRLRFPDGDLELDAPRGNIDLRAAGHVRVAAKRAVELESGEVGGSARSKVDLAPMEMRLAAPRLRVTGEEARFFIGEARWVGQKLRGAWKEAKVAVDTADLVADLVQTKAKDVYHKVEGVLQSQAGRLRTIVERSAHLRGRMLYFYADRDVKVDGDKIHLG